MRPTVLLIALLATARLAAGSDSDSPASTKSLLSAAQAAAEKDHKVVFTHFGASWCSWCGQFDAFLATPEVRAVVDRYFVEVKLDTLEEGRNRKLENPGAEAFLKKIGGEEVVFPFYAFLDAKGKLIVNSSYPNKGKPHGDDIGYPGTPDRIDRFVAVLKIAAPNMAEADIKTIESQLKDRAERTKSAK